MTARRWRCVRRGLAVPSVLRARGGCRDGLPFLERRRTGVTLFLILLSRFVRQSRNNDSIGAKKPKIQISEMMLVNRKY